MKILWASFDGLRDGFTRVHTKMEVDGVVYEGKLYFENDGRDAEVGEFTPELPAEVSEDFFHKMWDVEGDYDANNEAIEKALEIGYAKWEEEQEALDA